MPDALSRRTFLAGAGAAGAAFLAADPQSVAAALRHAREAMAGQGRPALVHLTPAQAATLEAVAMRIFPSDGTPGAREAGVIYYFDKSFGSFAAETRPEILAGLADLDRRAGGSFAALPADRQDAVLRDVERGAFFGAVRLGTIVGMMANPSWGGNRNQVGWKLLGFEPHGIYQPPFGWYDTPGNMKGGE